MAVYDIMQELVDANAMLKGHFVLSSGLHSDTYLQCAKLFEDPARGARVGKALAEKVRGRLGDIAIDAVVSPAVGGIIVGYEVARHLGLPSVFLERVEGAFALRRGFSLQQGWKVLIVEDVVTTGGSSLEVAKVLQDMGCSVVMECAVICRSKKVSMPFELVTLAQLDIESYPADQLPDHLKNTPPVSLGSRLLTKKKG